MLTQKQPWVVRASGMSDKGRVRENNEDNLFYNEKQGLFIVSDGMGGHQAGEVASRIVVSVLPAMIEQFAAGIKEPAQSKEPYQRVLRDAILQLSQDLRDKSKGQAGLQGMGATVVVVWILNQRAHMAYMGDSRIYLLRKGRLTQISNDHSVVALLVRHGQITEEEAKDHPARGRLSRYVGMEGDTFSDQRTIVVLEGDRLLLCSDGLTGMVNDDDIEKVLREYQDPDKACKVLIRMANEAGGKDNITAIIINFEAPHGPQESQKIPEQKQTPEQPVALQTSMPMQQRRQEQAQSPRPQNAPAPQTPPSPPEQRRSHHQRNIPVQQKPPAQPRSPRPPNIPPRPGKPESRLPEQQREGEKHRSPRQQEAPRRRVRGIRLGIYFGEVSERRRPDDRHGKPDNPKPRRP